ncbi:SusC/RagA family TonB-linked outer membrane protein [Longimicrobium terrae]|uniref:TonB-linked SusC/RagA family outer membrane protein n=1 Tax=Longimicrobium terrae TaxID=1639882 RepID=A0A841H4F1_9BACT|nr:TonB-dependent receptor [Longimicrobium terrae]MBB4638488.1 TonB-linked SusC/RagA family outer membrane protein [Longimicrobium terrae]MBB6072669.1 TonB-linked SusC/RagA family outer membrane protein [Longimicrobium terrae]NNC32455.1 TonB-dependent receptor [Longimicrobium terrae]
MRCWILPLAACLLFAGSARAQSTGQISGTVTEAEGGPVAGATVAIPAINRTVVTNERGRYTLNAVPAGSQTVTASRIGRTSQTRQVTVTAGQTATADFSLGASTLVLDEVVAIGYGTARRADVTGSVSSIRSEDITQVVAANPVDAIKGRIPGVDVTLNSPEPGATARIRIRGARSIGASNDPLFVVDGIPIQGDLRDIDQNSIESIDVLKDAAAVAVYGSRGANGVILITTKRGAAGPTRFSYSTSIGTSRILSPVDLMNGEQFVEMRREVARAGGTYNCPGRTACAAGDAAILDPLSLQNYSAGVSTDWQNEILRTGSLQSHEVSISGGNAATQFRVSGGLLDQTGITMGQGFDAKRGSVSLSHNYRRLSLQATAQGSRTFREIGVGARLWDEALFNSPLGRARNDDGTLPFRPTGDDLRVNPILEGENNIRELTRTNLLGTFSGTFQLTDWLSAVSSFGPQLSTENDGSFVGTLTRRQSGTSLPAAFVDIERRQSYTWSNYLQMNKAFGAAHRLQGTLLYEVASVRAEFDSLGANDLPYSQQLWHNLRTGSGATVVNSNLSEFELQSYMGRLNYTLNDRYTITATGRVDGSSVLAEGNKYAFFPAVGVMWRASQEPFFSRMGFLDDLKVRASFGRVGNSAIGPYQTQGQLSQQSYTFGTQLVVVGFAPGAIPNPDLKWETTDKYNAGIDFAVFNNRVSGALDVYRENTHDLLLPRALPYTSGYTSVLQNVGSTTNAGVEFNISTVNLDGWKGLNWESDFNISTNRNRITALQSGSYFDVGSGRWVNAPINVNFEYEFDGIWQTEDAAQATAMCGCKPGDIRVSDTNGDGVLNSDDRVFIGNHYNFPRYQGSFNNRFTLGAFDFAVLATARVGYHVSNGFIQAYSNLQGRFNGREVDYWTPENPSNENPRPNAGGRGTYGGASYYQNASHMRIRDITLGYRLPESLLGRVGGDRMRVYLKAQDPFLYAPHFDGWDPEAGYSVGDGNQTFSQPDVGGPSFRTFFLGADLSF